MSDQHAQTGEDAIRILKARALDHEIACARDIVGAGGLSLDHARASDLAGMLTRASALAASLDRALLARALAHNRDLARSLTGAIASLRPSAIDISRDLASMLPGLFDSASNTVGDIANDIDDIPIDVSGMDLSHLGLRQYLDILDGVVWSDDTRWPPGGASLVATRSEEIRPGIYQVGGDSEQDTR